MPMFFRRITIVLFSVGYMHAALASELQHDPLTYEAFLDLVTTSHPEQGIDSKRYLKAKQSIERAGVLPDPQIAVGRNDAPLPRRLQSDPAMPMSNGGESTVSLSQSVPWPGTLAAEEKAAGARVAAAKADLDIASLTRRFDAAALYLKIVKTAKIIEVERVNARDLNDILRLLHGRFEQGLGSHSGYLQAHNESQILDINLAGQETTLNNLKFYALSLIPTGTGGQAPQGEFKIEWPSALIDPRNTANADTSQDLTSQRIIRTSEAMQANQEAEYKRTMPNFVASGMLMQEDSGERMYAASVGISLPIFSGGKRSSLDTEGELTKKMSGEELAWHQRKKELALTQTKNQIQQIRAAADRLRNKVIPPVKEHIAIATAEFGQGRADLASIVEGRRMLLNLQINEILTQEALALANLNIEKIKFGLIDGVLNQDTFQVPGTSGGDMGMKPMPGNLPMGNMPKMKQGDTPSKKLPDVSPGEEEPTKPGMQGMGM